MISLKRFSLINVVLHMLVLSYFFYGVFLTLYLKVSLAVNEKRYSDVEDYVDAGFNDTNSIDGYPVYKSISEADGVRVLLDNGLIDLYDSGFASLLFDLSDYSLVKKVIELDFDLSRECYFVDGDYVSFIDILAVNNNSFSRKIVASIASGDLKNAYIRSFDNYVIELIILSKARWFVDEVFESGWEIDYRRDTFDYLDNRGLDTSFLLLEDFDAGVSKRVLFLKNLGKINAVVNGLIRGIYDSAEHRDYFNSSANTI